jgi:hypothetical protein
MSQTVSVTADQAREFYTTRIAAMRHTMQINMRGGKLVADAHTALETVTKLGVSMSSIPQAVSAIVGALDALMVAQMDQLKMMVDGQTAEIAALEAKLKELPPPGLVLPNTRH